MANRFLNNISINDEYTLPTADGSANQVIATDGSGNLSFVDQSGGASLSGGEASKVAVWSATDTLTHHDSFHFNTSNTRLGIGTEFPNYTLDVAGNIGLAQYGYIYFGPNTSNQLVLSNSLSGAQITQKGSGDLELSSASNGIVFKAGGTAKAKLLSSGNFGIGDTNPNRPLVVSETRTGSTATDAYTTVVKSVQSSGASPNPGTGGLKVQYTSSSSNVHAFGLVAGSSSSDFLTTGPMHFYTNSDLDTVSATGFAMQLDTSQRLTIGSTTATQKLNVDGNVKANRYYGHSSTTYYVDPDDGTASAILNGAVAIGDNATPAHKLVVRTPAGYGDGADGIFIKSSFAGSSPVVSDKDPFLSIGCADSSSAVATIFMGEDATATNQESKIEYSHDNATLGIFVAGQGSYREHVRFGEQSSSQARTRFYGNVGIGMNPSYPLDVTGDIQTTTGSVKIADNWGQGFYAAEQLSIVGSYPSLALRNNASGQDNKWLIHHDGNDLTFYAGANHANTTWAKKVQVDSGNQGMGAQRFYDIDSTSYYVEPGSAGAALTTNGYLYQAKEDYDIDASRANAIYQATRSTQTDRGTWPTSYMYAVNFGDRTKGIQLASRYGGANELYFRSGTDNSSSENGANTWKNWRQLYHVDYHPEADNADTVDNLHAASFLRSDANDTWSGDISTTSTNGIRFGSSNQTDSNDGYIAAGRFASGLNIVGTQTASGTGRQIRLWGNLITNDGNAYWHNGNDGSGSGLDADLLDGQHGSYYYSSANLPTKIKAGGNGPSTENLNTVANGVSVGQLEYRGFNSSSSNGPAVSDNANGVITVGQHSGNYSAQLAFSSNGNVYWRDNPAGNHGSWRKMWDSGNDGSGSGLDADLLDGAQGSSYLRSDASDTFNAGLGGILTVEGILKVANSSTTSQSMSISPASSGNVVYISNGNGGTIFFGVPSANTTNIEVQGVAEAAAFRGRFNTSYYTDHEDTGTSIRVAGDIVAYYSSDRRYKENIEPIESPIEKIKAINGVTFEWNEKSHKKTGKKDIGVIAQEVEKVLPEIVQTRDNGYKAVDYQKLTAVLIEAVKDQQKQIDELKAIINGSS